MAKLRVHRTAEIKYMEYSYSQLHKDVLSFKACLKDKKLSEACLHTATNVIRSCEQWESATRKALHSFGLQHPVDAAMMRRCTPKTLQFRGDAVIGNSKLRRDIAEKVDSIRAKDRAHALKLAEMEKEFNAGPFNSTARLVGGTGRRGVEGGIVLLKNPSSRSALDAPITEIGVDRSRRQSSGISPRPSLKTRPTFSNECILSLRTATTQPKGRKMTCFSAKAWIAMFCVHVW